MLMNLFNSFKAFAIWMSREGEEMYGFIAAASCIVATILSTLYGVYELMKPGDVIGAEIFLGGFGVFIFVLIVLISTGFCSAHMIMYVGNKLKKFQ